MVIKLYYLNEIYESKIIINKSVFICHLIPVKDIDEVNSYLSQYRKKYYDATHNCYAYIIGDKQEIQKCSDDGEPSKTAGAPMMDVLKKNDYTNILAIVTRYFGGILLGAGGLIRAYSESVSEAMKLVKPLIKKELLVSDIPLDYKEYNQLTSFPYINITNTLFLNNVIVTLSIEAKDKEKLLKDLESLLRVNNLELEFRKESKLTYL